MAYSSISQMGFMTVGIGVGLSVPEAWSATLAAILLYALHHGLAKGALFLGVGVAGSLGREEQQQRFVFLGLLLPALALAGAPLTSGAAAKLALKSVTEFSPAPWSFWIDNLLPVAAVGTALLMGRFLFLLRFSSHAHRPQLTASLWASWGVLIVSVPSLSWLFTEDSGEKMLLKTLSFTTLWPVLVDSLLTWAAWRWRDATKSLRVRIPPGDLLVGISWGWERFRPRLLSSSALASRKQWLARQQQETRQRLRRVFAPLWPPVEEWFNAWTSVGMLFLSLLAALFSLLAW